MIATLDWSGRSHADDFAMPDALVASRWAALSERREAVAQLLGWDLAGCDVAIALRM